MVPGVVTICGVKERVVHRRQTAGGYSYIINRANTARTHIIRNDVLRHRI